MMRSFGSDNHSGVHPKVMEALIAANADHAPAYGDDPWTARATSLFKKEFGDDVEPLFVFGGTGANVVGVAALTRPYHAILCASVAHLWVHECGAPEGFTGCKLIPIEAPDGKLTADLIRERIHGAGDEHEAQPKVVSITQSNELGLVYSPEETKAIADFVHSRGMYLHTDGARIANAAVRLGLGLRECTRDLGVDVMSFGGTKNGMMYGEAVLFFHKDLAAEAKYLRKRATQLPSKMRFVSAQMEALLTDRLWHDNARNANRMAALLAQKAAPLSGVEIAYPVETNMVFARLAPDVLRRLSRRYVFYEMDPNARLFRWVTSFDTTEEDIEQFVELMAEGSQDAEHHH
ncbi:MAG: low specificity L-threonine aldolase [Candidatus Sumerlaeota bacterium]|nr:low specificity L-threonine aldolase [Candidatus Sumerlaeota bacterium]